MGKVIKILPVIIIVIAGLFILGISQSPTMTDEQRAEREAEIEAEAKLIELEIQKRIEASPDTVLVENIGSTSVDAIVTESDYCEIDYCEIDRIAWYVAQSLRTQQEYESVCSALESWLDRNDFSHQNFNLVNITYLTMCFKALFWDIDKEQDLINRGFEPLDEEIWAKAVRGPLDKFEFIPVDLDFDSDFDGSTIPTLLPPSGSSDYCLALQDWISEYEGIGWLTSETIQEYNRFC